MVTSVAEHTNCTVDPEHTAVLIGVRVNATRVMCLHVTTESQYQCNFIQCLLFCVRPIICMMHMYVWIQAIIES